MPTVTPKNSELANRYGVNIRTVQRWRKAGVNVEDAGSVADYILKTHGHSVETLYAVTKAVMAQPKSEPWSETWKATLES